METAPAPMEPANPGPLQSQPEPARAPEPPEAEAKGTVYVVLVQGPEGLIELGRASVTGGPTKAIEDVLSRAPSGEDAADATYYAIPERSYKPYRRTVERKVSWS